MPAPPANQSRAARYAFMLVLGVLTGLVATVTHYKRDATRCRTA